jgi:DNA-binding HxlR family transcriptional regulator
MQALGESDSASNLRELVNHPHVVEVLDALTHGPMTFTDLNSRVHAGRRGLAAALRLVAARGLVAMNRNGNWDSDAPVDAIYRHTELGRLVVERLSHFSVWTAMYERTDAATGHYWKR